MTKVLVSPGFGAGWSTWASKKKKEIAEYQPIIEFIENGGDVSELENTMARSFKLDEVSLDHPLVTQMKEDLGLDYFYTGGAADLEIQEVDGPYRIDEYDGYESVTTTASFW